MNKMNDELNLSALTPAALSTSREKRFVAAMQAAAAGAGAADELECRLRHMVPSPMRAECEKKVLGAMQEAACHRPRAVGFWHWGYRWSAAAALFVFCASAGMMFMNTRASATVASGYASRSVIYSYAGEGVEWCGEERAVRPYEIHYEDSFVIDGNEGSTITVRVPNRTQLMLEAEVI